MAENATSADAELQLKKRARRRLVGATALALLAIIVLPMVMDREPRPPAQDIQVRIPDPESNTLPPLRAPAVEHSAAAVAEKPLTTSANPSPADASVTQSTQSTQPAQSAQSPATAKTTAQTHPPAHAPTHDQSASSSATPAAASQPAGTGSQPAATQSQQASQQQWVVQLGAYKDDKNVRQLQAKLKELKLPVYTEKIESAQGARTRVRAGPFASRDAAEKAQARIEKVGVGGTVAAK